ncbi:hypothetical protein ACFWF9_29010 [Streptomyces roseolus]|uniref:hypothetical protein n=1 Tax=Streptomyces roseolus TaxID=67358 RepID=UPI003648BE63
MDRLAGQARPAWWADHATCLGEYDIGVTVTVDVVGQWQATGRHADPLDTIQRGGWDFRAEMDPRFSLAFPGEDRGGIMVLVVEAGDGTLRLTEASDRDGSGNVTSDLTRGQSAKAGDHVRHAATGSGVSSLTDLSEEVSEGAKGSLPRQPLQERGRFSRLPRRGQFGEQDRLQPGRSGLLRRGFLSAMPPKHPLPTVTRTPVMAATAGACPDTEPARVLTSRLPPSYEEERWPWSRAPSHPHPERPTPSTYDPRGDGSCR